MGRKNKTRRYPARQIVIMHNKSKEKHKNYSRCAYCGRELFRNGEYRIMYDEFGQRVKKCRNESRCRAGRSQEAEDAYITAITGRRPIHDDDRV